MEYFLTFRIKTTSELERKFLKQVPVAVVGRNKMRRELLNTYHNFKKKKLFQNYNYGTKCLHRITGAGIMDPCFSFFFYLIYLEDILYISYFHLQLYSCLCMESFIFSFSVVF